MRIVEYLNTNLWKGFFKGAGGVNIVGGTSGGGRKFITIG